MAKKLNQRPGKKIFFNNNPQSHGQRELLENYLVQIRDKEKFKLEGRKKQIEDEKT